MKKKFKVIAACQDIGGCNAIYPVVEKMRRIGHLVLLFASLESVGILKRRKTEFSAMSVDDFESVRGILKRERPDLVLLGTSRGFSLEDIFVEESRKLNIPTVAVFDSWVNYSARFGESANGKALKYLPSYICASDSFAKLALEKEGIPGKTIVLSGNPYFDDLLKGTKNHTQNTRNYFLKKLGISPKTVIMSFFSQGIDAAFGLNSHDRNFLGYTQFDALRLLLTAMRKFYKGKDSILVVKPHPKENKIAYQYFRKHYTDIRITITEEEPRKILGISDIVAGMFSTTLIEGYLLGKKILSIQPSLCRDNPFILSRLGLVSTLCSLTEVLDQMAEYEKNKGHRKIDYGAFNIGRATINILNFITDLIEGREKN